MSLILKLPVGRTGSPPSGEYDEVNAVVTRQEVAADDLVGRSLDVDEPEVGDADHLAVVSDDRHRQRLADVVGQRRRLPPCVEQRGVRARVQRADVVVDKDGRGVAATVDDVTDVVRVAVAWVAGVALAQNTVQLNEVASWGTSSLPVPGSW